MKKIVLLLSVLLIGLSGFFTGCDEAEEIIDPKLSFFGGDYIDEDVTVDPGAVLKFSWLATKGASNLASFTIERDGVALSGYPDDDIPNDNYEGQVTLEAPMNEGIYVYKFTVTDNKSRTASVSFNITVESSGGPINTWEATLGSHQSATGSSFASTTGVVYSMTDATANSALIDFLYYYGNTNLATLAAPNDADAATVFGALSSWTTRNATKFATTTVSEAEFTAISDDLAIVAAATGASATDVNELSTGDVVAFVTAAGKMGLVKVGTIATGAGGTMAIVVKVQQ